MSRRSERAREEYKAKHDARERAIRTPLHPEIHAEMQEKRERIKTEAPQVKEPENEPEGVNPLACEKCGKPCKSKPGLLMHQRFCKG
jgi:hypothetical protein